MLKDIKSYVLILLIGLGVSQIQAALLQVRGRGGRVLQFEADERTITNREYYQAVSDLTGIPLNDLKIVIGGVVQPFNDEPVINTVNLAMVGGGGPTVIGWSNLPPVEAVPPVKSLPSVEAFIMAQYEKSLEERIAILEAKLRELWR